MRKVTKPSRYQTPLTLGQRIAFERKKKEITQETLASNLHIKRELLNMIENDARVPKVDTLMALSSQLGVTTDYLLGLSTDRNQAETDDLIKKLTELDGLGAAQKSLLLWSLGFVSEKVKLTKNDALKVNIIALLAELIQAFAHMLYFPEKLGDDFIDLATFTSPHRTAIGVLNKVDAAIVDEYFQRQQSKKERNRDSKGGDTNA